MNELQRLTSGIWRADDDSDSLYNTFQLQKLGTQQDNSSAKQVDSGGKAEPALPVDGAVRPEDDGGEDGSGTCSGDESNNMDGEDVTRRRHAAKRDPLSWFGVLVPPNATGGAEELQAG